MDLPKLFSEFGLIGIIIGTLFFLLWRMLSWVMLFIKEITNNQNTERVNWLAALEKHIILIDKISDGIDEIEKRADERGKFVRSENEKMINSLEEIGKVLARINGH